MNNLKLLQRSLLTLAGLTFLSIADLPKAQALTLVNLSLNQARLDDPTIRIAEICPEFTCQPNQVFFANNVNTPIITLLNNTEFTITGFTLKLLDPDAIFQQVSSELFPDFTLSSDRTETVFTGGILPINTAATFIIDSGAATVTFSAQLSGVAASVPEPSSTIGLIGLGVFSAFALGKKRVGL